MRLDRIVAEHKFEKGDINQWPAISVWRPGITRDKKEPEIRE
jgi:hypothetical protein